MTDIEGGSPVSPEEFIRSLIEAIDDRINKRYSAVDKTLEDMQSEGLLPTEDLRVLD